MYPVESHVIAPSSVTALAYNSTPTVRRRLLDRDARRLEPTGVDFSFFAHFNLLEIGLYDAMDILLIA